MEEAKSQQGEEAEQDVQREAEVEIGRLLMNEILNGGKPMMKKRVLVLVTLLMAAISSTALAQTPKENGREIITLKMGDSDLRFDHWKHQRTLKNECYHCHATKIGKIDDWSKETAHKVCIACHDLEDKGPVTCRQCHTKLTK
jgi:cytochrome c553